MKENLDRFLLAQENSYDDALQEMKNGKKTTHWMWYIFPQIKGLGKTDIARKFEIENVEESEAYLQHEVLGERLITLTSILVHDVQGKSAEEIFGYPDFMKFQSCLTLFSLTVSRNEKIFSIEKFRIFSSALNKFYEGKEDEKTLSIID